MTDHKVREYWEERGKSNVATATQPDHNLRELETSEVRSFLRSNDVCLDIGCGTGFSTAHYADRAGSVVGLDIAASMINAAADLGRERENLKFLVADSCRIPFAREFFDCCTMVRSLISLEDWEAQKQALLEVHRVLKNGGRLVILEGIQEGHDNLNALRQVLGLQSIERKWFNTLISERRFLDFLEPLFTLRETRSFDAYYLISRLVHPLLVAPDEPSFEHPINDIANKIAQEIDDLHLNISLNKMYLLIRH